MTPKEKAEYLVKKFIDESYYELADGWNGDEIERTSISFALIAVDEILEILQFDLGHDSTANGLCNYWEEVKQEIEKL